MKAVMKPVEEAAGPTGSIINDVLKFNLKHYGQTPFIAGDKLAFSFLQPSEDFEFIEAKVVNVPAESIEAATFSGIQFSEDFESIVESREDLESIMVNIPADCNRDVNDYGECDTKLCLTVRFDAQKYKVNDRKEEDVLKKGVTTWLTMNFPVPTWLTMNYPDEYIKVLDCKIATTEDADDTLNASVICSADNLLGEITESVFREEVWNKHMNEIIKEGVCYSAGSVPASLRDSLRYNIDELAKSTPVDYHPNSHDIVRDLVHPALYPYIKGVSKLREGSQLPPETSENEEYDFWGRLYEDSKFQWLPTPFAVSGDGMCSIQEYINNLDRSQFSSLYKDLENLFKIFLPYFQEVWSYSKAMRFYRGFDAAELYDGKAEDELYNTKTIDREAVSFNNKELQVITKIVDYTLQPQQTYEGLWHAEGMSHENIVMTGIYFLDRDPDIHGGDLKFKRAFTLFERYKLFLNITQDRCYALDYFACEGFVPLGRFPTEEGYLLVFPNCHIHRISEMINTSTTKVSNRRIVVFFLVNPEKKIISTREIPAQQNVIDFDAAKTYRLELMSERKYDKEKLNVRDVELCEH